MSHRFIKGSSGLQSQALAIKFVDEGDEWDSRSHVLCKGRVMLPLEIAGLRNPAHGDCIKWGSVKLSFWILEKDHTLSPAVKYIQEKNLGSRQTWAKILGLSL